MQIELEHIGIRLRKEREMKRSAPYLNQARRDVTDLVQRALQNRRGFWGELREQPDTHKPQLQGPAILLPVESWKVSLKRGQFIPGAGAKVPRQVGLGSHHNYRSGLGFLVKRKRRHQPGQLSRELVTGMAIRRFRGQARKLLSLFLCQLDTY